MEQEVSFESSNFNAKWLENIYENLKNLEMLERIGREGCSSLLEYLQIPLSSRNMIIADTQYKNLRLIVTELHLLLTDLTPVINKEKLVIFRENLKQINRVIDRRKLFVKENYNLNKKSLISSSTTPFFKETLEFLGDMRIEIIESIAHLLYVKSGRKIGFETG